KTLASAFLETGIEPECFIETIGHSLVDRILPEVGSVPAAKTFHSLAPFLRMIAPLIDARRAGTPHQPEWTNSALQITIEPLTMRWKNVVLCRGGLLIDNYRLRIVLCNLLTINTNRGNNRHRAHRYHFVNSIHIVPPCIFV